MKLILKKIHLTNQSLKIVSFTLGYLFWIILAQTQNIQISVDIPLYFYNLKQDSQVDAVETINIQISGKRSDMQKLYFEQLAAHIDLNNCIAGENNIEINSSDIFLHNKFKLISYFPHTLKIQIKENNNQTQVPDKVKDNND